MADSVFYPAPFLFFAFFLERRGFCLFLGEFSGIFSGFGENLSYCFLPCLSGRNRGSCEQIGISVYGYSLCAVFFSGDDKGEISEPALLYGSQRVDFERRVLGRAGEGIMDVSSSFVDWFDCDL